MECLKLFNRLWKSKRSFVLLHLLSFFLCISMLLNCSLGIKAEEIGPTPTPTPELTPEDVFYIATDELIEQIWYPLVSYVSKPFVIMNNNFATVSEYLEWLNEHNDPVLTQYPNVTVHSTHPPTGNIPLDVEQSENVDIPIPVQQSVINFIQYKIAENPTGYKICSISSYKFMNASQFTSYALYASLQEFISKQDGYVFISGNMAYGSFSQQGWIYVIPRDVNHGFYGTVNNGIFTNVQNVVNWQGGAVWNYSDKVKRYTYATDGTINEYVQGAYWNNSGVVKNGTSIPLIGNDGSYNVFTNTQKNEYVYVFDNINAYKNYNSGAPQDYYLTSEGLETGSWTADNGSTINTGSLDSSSYYYNNVVSNVQTGWTAEQVLALVDKISNGSSSGSGSGSSDDDENKKSKMWERIGNAIGNLIDGVVDVITSVVEKLTDAILSIIHLLTGYTDEGGTYHEGLLGKLTSLISVDFNGFLSSVFSWMPPEIVTLFTATLLFAVFFAIWKMIRG